MFFSIYIKIRPEMLKSTTFSHHPFKEKACVEKCFYYYSFLSSYVNRFRFINISKFSSHLSCHKQEMETIFIYN